MLWGWEGKLEKLYQELNEEDTVMKRWIQVPIPKSILLFHTIIFNLTFQKINKALSCLLVSKGLFLNYLLSKGE